MKNSKQTFITAFALFSLFFGAGNLILPPFLGYNAGENWVWVTLGFAISAVIIPILAIYGYARLQGTMLDFANKLPPLFAIMYSVLVYVISISLPSPRTASVTYEMAIKPYFEVASLWSSIIYFAMVLLFVLNRSKMLNIIGKFLTPLIFLMLCLIIGIGILSDIEPLRTSIFENSFTEGILEGYQTFDAIGGVVVGGVIVISLTLQGHYSYKEKKSIIAKAGLLCGICLFLIYGGLIALGGLNSGNLAMENRTQLLSALGVTTLGSIGTAFLGVLVALACFTTAVGIIIGTSDFVKKLVGDSEIAYKVTGILGCLIGVVVGQYNVGIIINVAIPVLMFIYPITIVLILLNVVPEQYASKLVFRGVTLATMLFSIPDFLGFLVSEEIRVFLNELIPLSKYNMGWLLPAVVIFLVLNISKKIIPKRF